MNAKVLNILLWVAQVLLAGMFIMAGYMKVSTPLDELSQQLPYVADIGQLIRFIGTCELLGGIGLILPAALRIKPILTPLAAVGILTIMIFAMVFHVFRGEYEVLGFNIIPGAIAFFIAWGRYKKAPINAIKD